jgi:hypothetical protein
MTTKGEPEVAGRLARFGEASGIGVRLSPLHAFEVDGVSPVDSVGPRARALKARSSELIHEPIEGQEMHGMATILSRESRLCIGAHNLQFMVGIGARKDGQV